MPLSLSNPTVGGDTGNWGTKLNAALSATVAFVNGLETTLAAKLGLAGGTMLGRLDLLTTTLRRIDKGNVSGPQVLDFSAGQYFTATVTGATTFSIANVPSGQIAYGVVLRLTNAGSAAVTLPTGTLWPGGSAPAFTASGVDLVVLLTDDNGTTWRASAIRDIR